MFARVCIAAFALCAASVSAESSGPDRPAFVHDEQPARDMPYPGAMTLHVDAADTARHIFRVRQTLPVAAPGPLTLRYPEWLPGKHAPRGAIQRLAGLRITGNGEPLQWRRDPLDVYAFKVDVPAGVSELEISFEYLSPTAPGQGRIVVTPAMLNLQWEAVSLYPAGHYARQIRVRPSVTLPSGWSGVAALDGETRRGDTISYDETDFETLVDSPMFAGAYYRAWDLGHDVDLNVFADRPGDLAATEAQIDAHERMVDQALKLFGAKPFDRYEFLFALTDEMGRIGLEHHRSSENALPRYYFTEWNKAPSMRGLLPHELVHSWNGKFRRPADLWTPDYRTPMQDSLLWVYEGQTSYWDNILGVRSGLLPKDIVLGDLAEAAAYYGSLPGRAWRPLADTTNDPIINARAPQAFRDYQRSEDYYTEGALIWLEADMLIRRETRGRRSLDDFARRFFGIRGGGQATLTYTFEDVVAALNEVHRHDWSAFLKARVERLNPDPARGLELGGYRLVWKDKPNAYQLSDERRRKQRDFSYSLGGRVDKNGKLIRVRWNGPLFKAGVATGAEIIAINGMAYQESDLGAAIRAASGENAQPIQLLVKEGPRYRMVNVDYAGGLRFPHLERIAPGETPLDRALRPLP